MRCFGSSEYNWGPNYASNAGILEAALPQLRRLTRLVLPPECGLQRLPPGQWLASLRSLVSPVAPVAASLPALSAAQRLQHLVLWARVAESVEPIHAAAVVRWAAGRPALRRLELQMGRQGISGPELLMAVAHLARRRPEVVFEAKTYVAHIRHG